MAKRGETTQELDDKNLRVKVTVQRVYTNYSQTPFKKEKTLLGTPWKPQGKSSRTSNTVNLPKLKEEQDALKTYATILIDSENDWSPTGCIVYLSLTKVGKEDVPPPWEQGKREKRRECEGVGPLTKAK